ncbi:lipase [Holotrichia oblita]|uniref:Lipase n=1 Tax=Holotrichia oblita TaxID=644536 RepID=A0ACB9T4G3_HOLOL|nr:lipase [Holotrichia oblita]
MGPVDYNLANALKTEITFHLFTSKFHNGIVLTEENAKEANIKANVPTKIFIHGWNSNLQGNWYNAFRDEYFNKGEYNIIYVDWFIPGSKEYTVSAANVKPVGHYIGDLIVASKINLEKVHLIGKSLGSHVASWTGKRVQELTGSKLNRITGLDPASPKFDNALLPENERLNKTDADFVDVIHTDAGYYGFETPIGTVDFYPNGGALQPGCTPDEAGHNDSHGRSNWYFLESINSTSIKAVKSKSWEDFLKGDYENFIKNIPVDYSLANAIESDIKLQLVTKVSSGLYLTVEEARKVLIETEVPTKVFIDGWNSNINQNWYSDFKDEYFQKGEYNVICVDWSTPGSKEYIVSAANVQPVGRIIADFLVGSKINLKTTHIISKALGAHVASWIGKQIYQLTGKKVNRITAFDPASLQFEHDYVLENNRLNSQDASFVDIVHTDAGYYGFLKTLGTVDFYANGGGIQPGCTDDERGHNDSRDRASKYFLETICSSDIKAAKCQSWDDFLVGNFNEEESIIFGEDVPLAAQVVHMYNIPPVNYSIADAVKTDITYKYFTKANMSGIYITEESAANILDENISTKFIIHGWLSNDTSYWYEPYRDECFKKDNYNFIYIDWSKAGAKEFYVSAANTKPIGSYIADFIISAKLQLDKVHIIGHSLGSNPAGPGFEHPDMDESGRVSNTDAQFVDVIHTDIGHYGFIEPIGHVDFYPNGGTLQPGCPSYDIDDNCSHARSNLYLVESVNSNKFIATPCSSYDDYIDREYDDLINLKDAGPLKFIVHGWGETMNSPYYKNLSDAYLERGTYSIIHVDWSKLGTTWYSRAITNTLEAEFILHLYKISKIDLDNIHILGHSLGAHVAGVAGETIHKRTGKKIGRITGLDPAKPLYEGFIVTAKKKLSKGDAKMVDIVHTDAGNFGCENNMGTVDFFPNGGIAVQPGCLEPITTHDIVYAIKNFVVVPFPHIDWSLKGDNDYLTASRNAKPVGDKIGEFLVNLNNKKGIPYKNMHLISHSLGCHVAGFTGKKVYEIANRKIGRITALDPAAPIFDLFAMGPSNRLSKEDATFVDVIHTDGGMLGFNYPIGTVDFFPNGGTAVQPGCSLLKVDVKYEDCTQFKVTVITQN